MKSGAVGWIAKALAFVIASSDAFAYKEDTHELISANAASSSILSTSTGLEKMGLHYPIADKVNQTFPNSEGKDKSILELIQNGARFEDGGMRAINHFFNPINGQPLGLTSLISNTAPDWAIEDKGDISQTINNEFTVETQDFSFKDGRGYFHKALTSLASDVRKRNWGLTFQSLGQMMHLVQDMAQPQHVRNDAHLDKLSIKVGSAELNPLYNPSKYEEYTNKNRTALDYLSYMPATTIMADKFKVPRMFWMTNSDGSAIADTGTDGMGMAQYTNRGFFSAGTLSSSDFSSPARETVSLVSLAEACQQALQEGRPPCDPGLVSQFGQAMLVFHGNTVHDSLVSENTMNPRAVTSSIFDQDLEFRNVSRVYALNRFNFDEALKLLIPRATAYSAGLINYFFRGKMAISLPSAGVYSIIDHATASSFDTVKLKVRNDSPNNEEMGQGTLQAVLKFHRNLCYTDDLVGYPPFVDAGACRSKDEEITLSDVKTIDSLSWTNTEFTFTFADPLPVSATDLLLQIVFKGQLGQEQDAVAVSTRNISEPTFITYMNDTDYIHVGGAFHTRNEVENDQGLLAMVKPESCVVTFGGQLTLLRWCLLPQAVSNGITFNGGAQAHISLPEPKRFARLVLLGDNGRVGIKGDGMDYSFRMMQWEESQAYQFSMERGIAVLDLLYTALNGDGTDKSTWGADELKQMSPLEGKTPVPTAIGGF